MGIKGLFPFLRENAESALAEKQLAQYLGCTLALDASTHLYQFLAAIRTGSGAWNLANANGEATSHIQGFANRTVKLLESGVRPVYVFDGASPTLKAGTLRDRAAKKREAEAVCAEKRADETAESSAIYKAASAATRVTKAHNDDAKSLLRLMGMPVVESPGEAEASCAAIVRAGLADAVVTEDMDALAFGAPVMVKNLFDVEGSRTGTSRPAVELCLERVLRELAIKRPKLFANREPLDAFVDFCILSGCDYLEHLSGIGPATAAKLLESHGASLDTAVHLKDVTQQHGKKTATPKTGPGGKLVVPLDWDYVAARKLFLSPDVVDAAALDLKLKEPDFDGLRTFLVDKHGFAPDRVDKLLARLRKARAAKPQRRIDTFFASPHKRSSEENPSSPAKRNKVSSPLCGSQASNDPVPPYVPQSAQIPDEPRAAAPATITRSSEPVHPDPKSPSAPMASSETPDTKPATPTTSPRKAAASSSSNKTKKRVLAPPAARITSFFTKASSPHRS